MKLKLILLALLMVTSMLIPGCTPAGLTPTATQTPTTETSPGVSQLETDLQGLSLDQFVETSFKALVMTNPESVLEAGLTEVYGVTEVELDDISDAFVREKYQMLAVILEGLEGYEREILSPEQQISYDIYQWYLEDQLSGQDFMYYDYPATYYPITAVHESLIRFFTDIHPVASLQDARDYVTRLNLVGTKIDQLIEGLDLRQEAGITPPEFAVQWALYGTLNSLETTSPDDTLFYTALENKLDDLQGIDETDTQAVLEDAEQAIRNVVLPAYNRLRQYMLEMETYSGGDCGVGRLPNGDEYYAYLLRHYTTTDITPEEVYQLGLQELERLHAEMRVIFDELGYPTDEDLVELFNRVGEDSGRVSGSDVLTTYERLIDDAKQDMSVAFDVLPEADVIVVGDDYGGFYISGSLDGSRPGAFYAQVTGSGEEYYAMPTLAYHETVPGHHLQLSLAQEAVNLPSFRRGITFTAFTEGWAVYAERLAWELGWYDDDPYGNLGRLQAEAYRAARLVVDSGMHSMGWTFQEAQDFFTENTGFESGDSLDPQIEIARYLVWPGQATSYYIGFLKILELRQRMMDQLGEEFDLVEFHHLILTNGGMPLEILERVVDAFIAEKKSGG